jgi:predicted CXXCH cytochrome family protein
MIKKTKEVTMKNILPRVVIVLLLLFTLFFWLPNTFAEDNNDVKPGSCVFCLPLFETPERPVPSFDHTLHEDTIGEESCAKCHHVFDTKEDKLIYSEGDEAVCSECHTEKEQDNTIALREASHKSCTGCHRAMKKDKKTAGPTTCGECHKK